MKHEIIPIIGDPFENLYQLGVKEKQSYEKLQSRVVNLLSANEFLRYGQDILSRAKSAIKKSDKTFFDQCVQSYADGLGVEYSEYMSFLSLFELAAHYGQVYPELKGLLPGCSSIYEKTAEGMTHLRLIDFPLIDIFNHSPRLYYWQTPGRPSILSYSCEGLAPLFIEAIHSNGWTMSLHHKPGISYHGDGKSIFQITFDTMFSCQSLHEFKKDIREFKTMTKWGYYLFDQDGTVVAVDVDGPASNIETFQLHESKQLIFTNIPIVHDSQSTGEHYLQFCLHRQSSLKEKLQKKSKQNLIECLIDVKDQKIKNWKHPGATLSTIGAFQVNLTTGVALVKEGDAALVSSDTTLEFSLADKNSLKVNKKAIELDPFEASWKRASLAQSAFDQGSHEEGFHQLQMAIALCPHSVWKQIYQFYLSVWSFKYLSHKKELSLIYREVKQLELPEILKDTWLFQCMRLEKKIGLVPTVKAEDVSPHHRDYFQQELDAKLPLFLTWMKLIYPRIEILDVFSPHHR